MDLSAVFIVPSMYTLDGTLNGFPEYGRIADAASSIPARLVDSIRVISSPKIFEMLPLLISSMINTYGFSFFSPAYPPCLDTNSRSSLILTLLSFVISKFGRYLPPFSSRIFSTISVTSHFTLRVHLKLDLCSS